MKLGVPWTPRAKSAAETDPSLDADAASACERMVEMGRGTDRLARITAGQPLGNEPRAEGTAAASLGHGTSPVQRIQDYRGAAERHGPSPTEETVRFASERRHNAPSLRPTAADPDLDRTVAEIAARQRALELRRSMDTPQGHEPRPHMRSAPRLTAPAPDMSGLEDKLRLITSELESLRRPNSLEEAVPALREEIAQIGRSLSEAIPQGGIETIEREIRELAQKFDAPLKVGTDARTLTAIERGLAELREALEGLTLTDSLAGLQSSIQGLAAKVDAIAASHPDPSILASLEAAVSGLRSIVSHVASDETLARLTDEVRALGAKMDRIAQSAAPEALSSLERRITSISEALERRNARGDQLPERVELGLKALADAVERLPITRSDSIAVGQIEDRIGKLVEKLDASGARLGHLEAIERGLADVMVQLEEQRTQFAGPSRSASESTPEIDSLKRDVAAVNGTLNRVVERLAGIETGIRSSQAAGPPSRPVITPASPPSVSVRPFSSPQPSPEAPPYASSDLSGDAETTAAVAPIASPSQRLAAAAAAQARSPQARDRKPIDPNLPPDHPIEPGAVGRTRAALSPADRIAASESALGPLKLPVVPDPGGQSSFIAAARRAAQAASESSESPQAEAADEQGPKEPLGKRLTSRVRSLLVGASIVALAVGGFRAITTVFNQPGTPAPQTTNSISSATGATKTVGPGPQAKPNGSVGVPDRNPPPSGGVPSSDQSDSGALPDAPSASEAQHAAAPSPAAPPPAGGDVTGSIPAAASARPAPQVPGSPAEHADTPSSDSEEQALEAAASAGNPAAAYKLAEQYLEGKGVQQSYADAARWLQPAAKQGLAPAQFRLATLYEKGYGLKKDLQAARRLYLAAAEKGNAKAMHNLAVLYAEGIDGKPAYAVAAEWFRKAADRGVTDSQYNLGVLYTRGFGVGQNLTEAYKWFALAAQQGDRDAARKRDDIAKRLDAQALTAAKLAVKTWVAKPQPEDAVTVKLPEGGWSSKPANPA